MRRYSAVLFLLPLFLSGCGNSESKKQIEVLKEGIGRNGDFLANANMKLYKAIETKRIDVSTKERTDRLWPTIENVKRAGEEIMHVLDSLYAVNPNSKLLTTTREKRWLFDQLFECKKKMMAALDSIISFFPKSMQESFTNTISSIQDQSALLQNISIRASLEEKEKYFAGWTSNNFSKSSPQFYQPIIGTLRNDVLYTENDLIEFCNLHTNSMLTCGYTPVQEAIVFDEDEIRPGKPVTVKIGLLNHGMKIDKVFINGNLLVADYSSSDFITYRFLAANKPGKYSFTLHLQVSAWEGSSMELNKIVKYEVVP